MSAVERAGARACLPSPPSPPPRARKPVRVRRLAIAASGCAFPGAALAHAFGERYDLPAPLPYFVAGAALTVALSFVVIAWALRRSFGRRAPPSIVLAQGAWLAAARRLLQILGVALLLLVFIAGAIGDPHPGENIAPTLVWIAWWVGLSLAAACVGNLWPALDPWRALYEAADALARRLGAAGIALNKPYPTARGMWPAASFLLLLAWIEIVFPGASKPSRIALWAGAWTVVNLGGIFWYGRENWQRHADFATRYFDLLGRFAPLAATPDGRAIVLRWPGAGLLAPVEHAPGRVAFAVAMLATVLFDGLLGTHAWRVFDRTIASLAPQLVDRDDVFLGTIGIVLTWSALLGAYLAACASAARLLRADGARRLAQVFAASLVPIAIGYHVAHNFSYFVEEGRGMWALVSDPLGRGWDLFSTANYRPELGVVGARVTWYVAIGAIVVGHVVSIWIAHRIALQTFGEHRRAVLASVPLTVLMVGYTAVSLTIIAEPLVRFREPDPSYSWIDGGLAQRAASPVDRTATVPPQECIRL